MRTALVVSTVVAVSSGIAIGASSGGGEKLADAARRQAPPVQSASAQDTARLSVLSAAPAAENPLGEAAEYTSFADTARAQPVLPSGAAGEERSEWKTWVAPGLAAGEICLLGLDPAAGGAGGGCGDVARAVTGEYVQTYGSLREGVVVVMGLMPDGVDSVTLTMKDGSAREVPVANNAYRADVTTQTETVTFRIPGERGSKTIPLGLYAG